MNLSAFGDIAASVASVVAGGANAALGGGATAIIGLVVQSFTNYKSKKAEIEFETKRMDHELEMLKAQAVLASQAAAASVAVAATDAFKESYKRPEKMSVDAVTTPEQNARLVRLDILRGSIRPYVTIFLFSMTTLIWIAAYLMYRDKPFTLEQAHVIFMLVTNTIIYLTVTCGLWYFGGRNTGMQNRIFNPKR